MTDRRLHVCLVPYYADNPYQRQLVEELRALQVEISTRKRLKGLVADLWLGRSTADVVHLHWLPAVNRAAALGRVFMFVCRVALLRLSGCRIVWTVHNLYAHEGRWRWLERSFTRTILRLAHRVVVHSPTAAGLVAEEFGPAQHHKITTIPHGHYVGCYPNRLSRAEARQQLGLDPRDPVLLFLGKIRPYKGVKELVQAFQQLRHPTARLLIAGEPLDQEVLADIQRHIESPRIHLKPVYVPDHDIQLYMNAADAVVFPYQDVLTSGAVVLAMSFAKACIAARLGCICDTLDDDGGILYDPLDEDALQNALAAALTRQSDLEEMGQHNLERVSDWTWAGIAQATCSVYFPGRVLSAPARRAVVGGSPYSPLA